MSLRSRQVAGRHGRQRVLCKFCRFSDSSSRRTFGFRRCTRRARGIDVKIVRHRVGSGHVVLSDDEARGFAFRTRKRFQFEGPRCLSAAEIHCGEVFGQFFLRNPQRLTAPDRILVGSGNLVRRMPICPRPRLSLLTAEPSGKYFCMRVISFHELIGRVVRPHDAFQSMAVGATHYLIDDLVLLFGRAGDAHGPLEGTELRGEVLGLVELEIRRL